MRQIKVLILTLVIVAQLIGKQHFAPGWSASRAGGCQWVQVSGQITATPLIVDVQDSATWQWVYADEVPGNYFSTTQNLDLGACVQSINLYVYPAVYPYTYLIFAQWMHAPVQSIKLKLPMP